MFILKFVDVEKSRMTPNQKERLFLVHEDILYPGVHLFVIFEMPIASVENSELLGDVSID